MYLRKKSVSCLTRLFYAFLFFSLIFISSAFKRVYYCSKLARHSKNKHRLFSFAIHAHFRLLFLVYVARPIYFSRSLVVGGKRITCTTVARRDAHLSSLKGFAIDERAFAFAVVWSLPVHCRARKQRATAETNPSAVLPYNRQKENVSYSRRNCSAFPLWEYWMSRFAIRCDFSE